MLRRVCITELCTCESGSSFLCVPFRLFQSRARIFKLLRSPGIDSKELIPPAYVAWRAWDENLSLAMGRGINSRNRVWNWVAKLHRLSGRYDNPMPTWFLAPIAGLKLPTLYDNPIPTRFLAPIGCSKIPALFTPSGLERSVWRLSLARNRFTEIPHTSVARLHKLNYLDLSGIQK